MKKKREYIFRFLLTLLFCFIVQGKPMQVDAALTMSIGDSRTLTASGGSPSYPASGYISRTYVWSVDNSRVISRDSYGDSCRITAVGTGTARVSCTVSLSYSSYDRRLGTYMPRYEQVYAGGWTITVGSGGSSGGGSSGGSSGGGSSNGSSGSTASVKKIWLNKERVTLKKGKTTRLYFDWAPSNATTTVTWSSSNEKVATVSKGTVKAIRSGKATITAKTANGKKASCKITVIAPIKSVRFSSGSLNLGKGDKYKLKPVIDPVDCSDKITWSSSNRKVASVRKDGTVTAKKNGKTTITLKIGSKKAKCTINVKNRVRSIKPTEANITLVKGKSRQLTYKVTPSNAGAAYTWTSSNSKVVTVSQSGKITAKNAGSATITVKASSGASAKYKIKVIIPATKITCSKTSLALGRGRSYKLSCRITPASSTDKVTWTSSNSQVASVNSKGTVTGKKDGTAWITVKAGKCSAKCKVTVKSEIPATSLNIVKTDPAVIVGKTLKLSCKLGGPETMTDSASSVRWSSGNTAIASVSASGTVRGIRRGQTVITASLRNMKATYRITVTEGAWVDISETFAEIWHNSVVDTNKGRIQYTTKEGLTLLQSNPSKANRVSFRGAQGSWEPRRIVLAGVKLVDIYGSAECDIWFDPMENTQNTIDDWIFARLLLVDGEGALTINFDGSDPCIEANTVNIKRGTLTINYGGSYPCVKANSININGGKIYINRKNTGNYALRAQSIFIRSGASVGIRGSGNLYYASLDAEIAPNTLYVMDEASSDTITGLQITGGKTQLETGACTDLKCYAVYSSGTKKDITSQAAWSSGNTQAASISSSGRVQGKAAGNVTFTAVYRGMKATYQMQITARPGVDISKGSIDIYGGYYVQSAVSSAKIPFSPQAGLIVYQSAPTTNGISVNWQPSFTSLRLNLTGVQLGWIDDSGVGNLIVDLKGGSSNGVISDGIRLDSKSNLTIQGSGSLSVSADGPALRGGNINIMGGNVLSATRSEYGSSVLAYGKLSIAEGAHLTDKRNLDSEPVSEQERGWIADGRLTVVSNK